MVTQMSWEQQQRVESEAPSHVVLPTGSKVAIEYGPRAQPTARARLQVRVRYCRRAQRCSPDLSNPGVGSLREGMQMCAPTTQILRHA